MSLPSVRKVTLNLRPVDRLGLPHNFTRPGELEVLLALADSVRPKVAVEIGCNNGCTSKILLHHLEALESLIGVDVLPGYVCTKRVQRREVPTTPGIFALDDPRFTLKLRARGSLDLSDDDLPMSDLVFIDGDHSRPAVVHDTLLARKVVRPGGIILWHDYHDRGTVDVKPVLDECYARGDDIRHVKGTWLAFQRI